MNTPIRILAGMLLALGLAACQHPAPPSQAKAAPPMQLKLYSVPPQKSQMLLKALREVVPGRIHEAFPGKLLVAAPADEQASIGAAIETLAKTPVPNVEHAQFRVHFWVVDMLPGSGADTPALKPLAATLDALRKQLGPAHFELADTASATTLQGHLANRMDTANRHLFEFWIPSTSAGHVQLALQYIDRSPDGFRGLKTSASMPLGDYVVLAQAAAPRTLPDHRKAPPQGGMRLLVVRVDKLAAHAD